MTAPQIVGEPQGWIEADWPWGAHVHPDGTTSVAIPAPRATALRLEIYPTATGTTASFSTDLVRAPDGTWRTLLDGAGHGTLYGVRAWGGSWPVDPGWTPGSAAGFVADVDEHGDRFNPNKVLLDPYAREITHPPASEQVTDAGFDPGVFGTGGADYRGRPRREWDTALVAPKAVVVDDTTATGTRPHLDASQSAVYEAHVVGLTAHPTSSSLRATLADLDGFADVLDVPEHLRGTYAGAGYLAPYLRALGFTTIELLPVHQFDSTATTGPGGRVNAWGYMTLGFFAPHRAYAHDTSPGGPTRELKEMIRAFHDAGIEVYLDVVYNHTAEGGTWSERDTTGFVSFGGLGTSDWYVLTDDGRPVDGATGCGNQVDFSSPVARRMVLDSLTWWADAYGVDGFRFDLAPVLGRTPDAFAREDWASQKQFFPVHPLLVAVRDLAADKGLEVIAEAWDLWGYEVGNFPAGWSEWNGRFRDGVRRFLRGDADTAWAQAMLAGDEVHFNDNGGPQRSVNFLTAHDGFTLADLVSYDQKVNDQPWPFGPTDGGSDDNLSWGSGGDQALRRARLRTAWVLLFIARGVPMVVAGDELGRTQNGNNNPWSLTGVGMWVNWAMASSRAPQRVPVDPSAPNTWHYHDNLGESAGPGNPVLGLAAYLARLRRDTPALRQPTYGDDVLGDDDVTYFFTDPTGGRTGIDGERSLRLLIDTAVGPRLLVCINQWIDPVTFTIPDPYEGRSWRRIVDTSPGAEADGSCWAVGSAQVEQGAVDVAGWSVVVLHES